MSSCKKKRGIFCFVPIFVYQIVSSSELADLVYVCFQYAENMEWDLEEALDRVHKSNMSKLGINGKPIRRADGKVLKGPNYQPPNLNDLVNA